MPPVPMCCLGIHVFLGCGYTNTNDVYRLVNPILDRNAYIFKVNVSIKQAKYE